MTQKSIVIGRQYGSGGYDIGKRLAEELGYSFYDKEIVELAAKKGNFHADTVKKLDENAKGSFLYSIAMGNYSVGTLGGPVYYDMPINDKLFLAQSEIIKESVAKGPCVFVGRCADYVLSNAEIPHLSVFLYADMDYKANRVAQRLDIPFQKARDKVVKIEKQRRSYYDYYTNRDWGLMKNYDLCLSTSVLGEDKCFEIIKAAVSE
ncbi:MAG: cytidylate kinase-like family protein [Clostridia bacterium]|nr:cytidylate kinase-like family protein [Clostridia bacterium]